VAALQQVPRANQNAEQFLQRFVLALARKAFAEDQTQGEAVMKRVKFVMVSLALFAALICALALGARADDKQTISNLEHKAAVQTDPDEIMKLYDSGDDVVVFDVMSPREFAGRKAIRDHMKDFAGFKDVKVEFLEFQVVSDGKLALARSVQHYTAKDRDGKPIESTFRQTDIWRKTNGQWKLIHAHVSYPVDMKTGRADMASKK
jgi:ketosteroid isomerase-like protein